MICPPPSSGEAAFLCLCPSKAISGILPPRGAVGELQIGVSCRHRHIRDIQHLQGHGKLRVKGIRKYIGRGETCGTSSKPPPTKYKTRANKKAPTRVREILPKCKSPPPQYCHRKSMYIGKYMEKLNEKIDGNILKRNIWWQSSK